MRGRGGPCGRRAWRRPEGGGVVPGSLDWDLWLAGAPLRPYKHNVYHRFNWRGWRDFGTGALGDAVPPAERAVPCSAFLAAPASVEAVEVTERQSGAIRGSAVRFGFAARGRKAPPVTLDWYDGGASPKRTGWRPVTATFDLLGSGSSAGGRCAASGWWAMTPGRATISRRGGERRRFRKT